MAKLCHTLLNPNVLASIVLHLEKSLRTHQCEASVPVNVSRKSAYRCDFKGARELPRLAANIRIGGRFSFKCFKQVSKPPVCAHAFSISFECSIRYRAGHKTSLGFSKTRFYDFTNSDFSNITKMSLGTRF